MAVSPTYPGVYIEELPSGVRTIAGVSTSVTVFMGSAKRGPINKAVPVRSFADFERRYGGLFITSEMSYAVRDFFNNGGSEAIIIRVAAGVQAARKTLQNDAAADVLDIEAADAGSSGNNIEILIGRGANPNTFSLTAILRDPNGDQTEPFDNLSMNSHDPRYVETVINSGSTLIKANRHAGLSFGTSTGTSTSGALANADIDQLGPAHNQFRLSVNGSDPITIDTGATIGPDTMQNRLNTLCTRIHDQAVAKGSGTAFTSLTCTQNSDHTKITITSGDNGEFASVRVLPGLANDASHVLKLGDANGGVETDGTSSFRPAVMPTHGSVTSTAFSGATDLTGEPSAAHRNFKITLDNGTTKNIDLTATAVTGSTTLERLHNMATLITGLVSAQGTTPEFTNFTATVDESGANPKLVFSSGTTGNSSAITVAAGASNDVLATLNFTNPQSGTGKLAKLDLGTDQLWNDSNIEQTFVGSLAARSGIYALEGTDIFNLLCLPGVTKASILAAAAKYCEDRRAFLIADPPPGVDPDGMVAEISGTRYPKSRNGAVYYPRIGVSDPLQSGTIQMKSPSGAVAGVFARTDSSRGVWKAPAGVDASLSGVQQLEYVLTDAQNGALNPLAVNCLRIFPIYAAVTWGARTFVGANARGDEWKYVPVRRLALYIEESLFRGTKWAVFEPNDEPLWAQLRLNVGVFMQDLFRQGAFAGSSPREAYRVECGRDTTTQSDVNQGIVNILVGFAPLKPAEFVYIKIQQLAGQLGA